ncbi:MAG: protein kinase [Proteobacteria bacterium]|nr:protein kinase [Pseudomonadota bacterium]
MAEVFRAKAYGVEGFERLVAVKRILPNISEDKEFIAMFIDEAKIAVQLNHANIAQIFDLGMVDGSHYIALEHVHGRDLRAIFDRCRDRTQPMPIAQAAFIIMKVCEGLDYAHNKRNRSGRELNLVHRDVSPQNILVSFEGEVKLIDFGIAKAAGKGSRTQAGILKGKFGYMSPEQVRGLPIDRRSDVFSCGIVLYELLTGERLFVGGSDFSTLEKVRNVEILPPSTYNRIIPPELERIVLKTLTKDMDDRYQNAIDLHDDLQAFVYTAGEFYSRKDLAAWMKQTFRKEIERETAILESYRQFRPPEVRPPVGPRVEVPNDPRRATLLMPSAAPAPPPPPIGRNDQSAVPAFARPQSSRPVARDSIPPQSGELLDCGRDSGRKTTPNPSPRPLPDAPVRAAMDPSAAGSVAEDDLNWEEEELDTQIYRGDEKSAPVGIEHGVVHVPAADANVPYPTVPGTSAAAMEVAETIPLGSSTAAGAPRPPTRGAEARSSSNWDGDDQSVVDTAKGWESSVVAPPTPPTPHAQPAFAAGSSPARSPFEGGRSDPVSPFAGPNGRELGGVERSATDSVTMPAVIPRWRRGTGLYVGLATAVLILVVGGIAAYALMVLQKADQKGAIAATATVPDSPPPPSWSPEILAETGFDLIVAPTDVIVKLDGKTLDLTPPMKVRNIVPGDHELIIKGPAGFYSKSQNIRVDAGKARILDIKLDSIDIIGRFESNPPGAQVTLLVKNKAQEIELGRSPARHELDARNKYDVRFEKDGYVTKIVPIAITGARELAVSARLERESSTGRSPRTDRLSPGDKRSTGQTISGNSRPRATQLAAGVARAAAGAPPGILILSSKPRCQIYVDGQDTGKWTPQLQLKLSPGPHRITLINNDHGIKESFRVTIKSGERSTHIKDYTARMQKL